MTDLATRGLSVIRAHDGETHWVGTSLITTKLTAEQTSGQYGLILSKVARGAASPLHVHHGADEGILVLSGQVRVRCGEDEFTLTPGDYAHLPRGVPHTFVPERDSEMIGLVTPGGSEAFYTQAGPVATSSTPPPLDRERMARVAEQNDCEILGPGLSLDG